MVVVRAVPPVAAPKKRMLLPLLAEAVSVAVLPAQMATGVLVPATSGLFTVTVLTLEVATAVPQRTWAR